MKVSANLTGKKGVKSTAANGRFGVMAAVIPQKQQCKFESLYPAGSSVEAATTPSRWDVARNGEDRVRKATNGRNTIKDKKYRLQKLKNKTNGMDEIQ